nr:ABC transporter substrate-binding protein [Kibdelosporangium sp. MJ126-NF4]CEL14110.1 probable sugar transporter sugar binding lipoprotein [Kibdelosporangium sp. MJ126-NF4]CTQ88477.1 probable sugar transporter sugar binding lipoprotein [Kibdelosporangium sp. MJ126-NF4]
MSLRVASVLVGCAMLASVTACASSSEGSNGPADPNAPVTITWWTGQPAPAHKLLEELTADFQKLHPNVTVKLSSGAPTTDEIQRKLSASFASGEYPDISYAYGSWTSELADSGRMLDITEKVRKPDVRWNEFPEVARTTVTPGGKVVGFPAVIDNLVMCYNKTIFDKAGVAYPTENWTWDDFRAAAKKLTDPATTTYGYGMPVDGSEATTWQLWPMLWQLGGDVLSPDNKKTAFASPAGVRALELLRGMAVDDKSVYLDQTTEKYYRLFASNQVGMIKCGPWYLYDFEEAKTNFGVVPLPAFDGKHTTVSGPDMWGLFDHKDANRAYWSYELVKWLTDPEQNARWGIKLGNLPLRDAERDMPAYKEMLQKYPALDMIAKNLANATKPRPTIKGYVGVSAAVGEAMSKTLQGASKSNEALDAAAAKADQALAES